jgi:hypothetical protein
VWGLLLVRGRLQQSTANTRYMAMFGGRVKGKLKSHKNLNFSINDNNNKVFKSSF